ncbi:MAG: DUF4198 domain-containing protein [Parashewanella sp.]
MKKLYNSALLTAMLALTNTVSTTVSAHSRVVIPSHFTISKTGGDWVTFDITGTESTFVFDKTGGNAAPEIVLPNGQIASPDMVIRGQRRSVFDFRFRQQGTHKVVNKADPKFITFYNVSTHKKPKRIRVNKTERDRLLPEGATNIRSIMSHTRSETYVTVGRPTDSVFKIDGNLLEMKPITHPSDIIEGEPVTMQFYYNGKVKPRIEAVIIRDGTPYRNNQEEIVLTSDKDGKITFTPPVADRYLMKASYKSEAKKHPLADTIYSNVHLTFEAALR